MGSKVGRQAGYKIESKKMKNSKRRIRKLYKLFGGPLSASDTIRAIQVTKSTFYRYLD